MYFYDALYKIARNQKTSIANASISLGRSRGYIAAQKNRGSNPTIDTAAKMANAFNYTICLVPSNKIPKDSYVIE